MVNVDGVTNEHIDVGESCWVDKTILHAKSQCIPSSREKQRPVRIPSCLSQKMVQEAPEKKMPLTVANTVRRSLKVQEAVLHQ
jgi:hypothetical protein